MNDLENKIQKYFETKSFPTPNQDEKTKLMELTKQNRKPKRNIVQKVGLSLATCVVLLIAIILPIALNGNTKSLPPQEPQISYFTDTDLMQKTISEIDCFNLLDSHCARYSNVLSLGNVYSVVGYYIPNTDKILAFKIAMAKTEIPFTEMTLTFVISEQFVNSVHESYISKAEVVETSEYKLYKKESNILYGESLTAYFEYSNYKLYLNFDMIDEELFEQFI